MAEGVVCISHRQNKPIKVLKWKVREGTTVSFGRIIFLYNFNEDSKNIQLKLKCKKAGTIKRILIPEGAIARYGDSLYELEPCKHPTVMHDMCAECGADLRKEDNIEAVASVPMVHAIPDLKVSEEQAKIIGKADSEMLLRDRKLVLLVDLDQTLIHTTNDNIPANIKDVYHFQLYGPQSPWYHTRLRPGTHQFLENIFSLFELHICTFGTRNYAHTIAMFLDKDQKLFSNRILSRDECFDATSKKANLKALFPCGDNLVCIIDDREDVWSNALNLIHVKPYHFFRHTGDINAPPGLDKHEEDERSGVDLTHITVKKSEVENKNGLNNEIKNNSDSLTECNEQKNEVKDQKVTNEDVIGQTQVVDDESVNSNNMDTVTGKDISSCEKSNNSNGKKNDNKKPEESIDNAETQKVALETFNEVCENAEIENSKQINISNGDTTKNEEKTNQNLVNKDANNLKVNSRNEDENSKINENPRDETVNNLRVNNSKENENIGANQNPLVDKEDSPRVNKSNKGEHKTMKNSDNGFIEIEDEDSYLLYLESILKQIHEAFYKRYDVMQSGGVPDLKQVIPEVKSRVLKGTKLCFSGLVPTHLKLEQSKAFLIAKSLGAEVTQDLEDDTTHLVAVRPGTAKVNVGKRKKNLKIVTPDWLWCCAERWEHAEENIFPLNNKGSKNRHPPPHCHSPEHSPEYPIHSNPALRKRTPSGRFMDTINPLMSFSSADIADMDKEKISWMMKVKVAKMIAKQKNWKLIRLYLMRAAILVQVVVVKNL
ncbi:hypothetical protein WA026_019010 [Henosepilachna vigintioctopunctata]|uniref:RNA polymerase II subunit A C-terminal domain phosphatase n=1 Tax=Henosepilachna vigintioctopunctata TaxID=420089 RepID=A0AAW1VFW2_9CUCU